MKSKEAESLAKKFICAEVISALKPIYIFNSDLNQVKVASSRLAYNEAECIGVSLEAGQIGDKIKVILFGLE